MTIYPWQQALWRRVTNMRDRMPHALLLQGRAGIGKLDFARALAAAWLCERPSAEGLACGNCHSCNFLAQGNHPDFRFLEPEEIGGPGEAEEGAVAAKGGRKTQISVDQVRDLSEFIGLSSHRAGLRIVLLQPAESLNLASANALLKMLEEPPPGVMFILVSSQPQRLLPTIRSRCSTIDMPVPALAEAEAWLSTRGVPEAGEALSYFGGAPLLAEASDAAEAHLRNEACRLLARGGDIDAMQAASRLMRGGMQQAIDQLQKWICDLLALRLGGEVRYHRAARQSLQGLAEAVDLRLLLEYQNKLNESRRYAQHPLNAELQLESLMFQYSQLFTVVTKS